jgi:hypothetical protein
MNYQLSAMSYQQTQQTQSTQSTQHTGGQNGTNRIYRTGDYGQTHGTQPAQGGLFSGSA